MDAEEYSLLKKTNVEQGRKIEVLEQTIKKLTEPAGPTHVSQSDMESGRVRVSPEDVVTGKVIIDMPDGEPKEPRQLKANEILKTDHARIAANLERVASGEMVVVD